MTAKQLVQALAQMQCDRDTTLGEVATCQMKDDQEGVEIWRDRVADISQDMRTEVWRLAEKDWMPRPGKTARKALQLLGLDD